MKSAMAVKFSMADPKWVGIDYTTPLEELLKPFKRINGHVNDRSFAPRETGDRDVCMRVVELLEDLHHEELLRELTFADLSEADIRVLVSAAKIPDTVNGKPLYATKQATIFAGYEGIPYLAHEDKDVDGKDLILDLDFPGERIPRSKRLWPAGTAMLVMSTIGTNKPAPPDTP